MLLFRDGQIDNGPYRLVMTDATNWVVAPNFEEELPSGVQVRPAVLAGPVIALEDPSDSSERWLGEYFGQEGLVMRRLPAESHAEFSQRTERVLRELSALPWLAPRRLVLGIEAERTVPLVLRRRVLRSAFSHGVREVVFLLAANSSSLRVRHTFDLVEQAMRLVPKSDPASVTCKVVFVPLDEA